MIKPAQALPLGIIIIIIIHDNNPEGICGISTTKTCNTVNYHVQIARKLVIHTMNYLNCSSHKNLQLDNLTQIKNTESDYPSESISTSDSIDSFCTCSGCSSQACLKHVVVDGT